MRLEPSLGGDWAHLPGRVARERLSHPVADAPQARLGGMAGLPAVQAPR
jgi:hypothetical protein